MIDLVDSDEDTWVMPDGWRHVTHRRRDRPDVPAPVAPDPGDAERVRFSTQVGMGSVGDLLFGSG